MAIRNIITEGDELLRKKCKPVTDFNQRLATLLDDMHDTLREANGVGLAGPQVGVLRRVFVVDVAADKEDCEPEYVDMCNPEILEISGEQRGMEGCLSVPGEYGIVTRPMQVKAKYFTRNGEEKIIEAEGLIARCICHEYDHLDGILYIDLAEDVMTEEELDALTSKKKKRKE